VLEKVVCYHEVDGCIRERAERLGVVDDGDLGEPLVC
jgi:hypothetical protein